MIERLRIVLARFSRRLAHRLSPAPAGEAVVPIEFIGTDDLVAELGKRHELLLIVAGSDPESNRSVWAQARSERDMRKAVGLLIEIARLQRRE